MARNLRSLGVMDTTASNNKWRSETGSDGVRRIYHYSTLMMEIDATTLEILAEYRGYDSMSDKCGKTAIRNAIREVKGV